MRRPLLTLLVACLLGASGGSALAQETSPAPVPSGQQIVVPDASRDDPGVGPTIEGGRVEHPAEGFTVTFPATWEVGVFDDAMHERVESETGSDFVPRPLAGALGDDGEGCVLSNATLMVQEVSGWEHVDEAAVGTADNATEAGWSEASSRILHLPAGRVASIELIKSDGTHQNQYVYTDGQRWFELLCQAVTPAPEDRWLSVAETFEFLPADE